jgi:AAA domain
MRYFTGASAPEIKPIPWVAKGLLAQGAGTIIFGQPGVGKSTHVLALVAALVAGKSFGPFAINQKNRVLYIDCDSNWDLTGPLLDAAFRGVGVEGTPEECAYFSPLMDECHDDGELFVLEEKGLEIAKKVREHCADVVILDSLGQAMAGDPDKGMDASLALRLGLNPSRKAGAAVVVIDHATKAGKPGAPPTLIGSQQKRVWCRVSVSLEQKPTGVRWSIDKINAAKWQPFLTNLAFDGREQQPTRIILKYEDKAPDLQVSQMSRPDEVREEVMAALGKGSCRRGVFPRGNPYERVLALLLTEGAIQKDKGRYSVAPKASLPKDRDTVCTTPSTPLGGGGVVQIPDGLHQDLHQDCTSESKNGAKAQEARLERDDLIAPKSTKLAPNPGAVLDSHQEGVSQTAPTSPTLVQKKVRL